MTDAQLLSYVVAAAAAQGIALSDQRASDVVAHMALAQRLASLLDGVDLAPHDELVQIYCPAPFPHTTPDEPTA
ncbi:MAG: AtzG-like protein [Hydrogenophaga sp.]